MYLAPLNYDRFFRKIFKDDEIAKAFLEDFLDVKIDSIEKLDDKHRITDKSKVVEFDYRCKIEDKYIIIDMQQWYKPDVSQRFYMYHAMNAVLQLEDLKDKTIRTKDANKKDKVVREIKDYRLIEPVITLIWMVDDSFKFKSDFIAYKLLPDALASFVTNNDKWEYESFHELLLERNELLIMMNNKNKQIDFLQKNKLIFMFQKNIVKNMESSKKSISKLNTKYAKWFDFAYPGVPPENDTVS